MFVYPLGFNFQEIITPEAEKILNDQENGTYLIRKSSTTNKFLISIRIAGKIQLFIKEISLLEEMFLFEPAMKKGLNLFKEEKLKGVHNVFDLIEIAELETLLRYAPYLNLSEKLTNQTDLKTICQIFKEEIENKDKYYSDEFEPIDSKNEKINVFNIEKIIEHLELKFKKEEKETKTTNEKISQRKEDQMTQYSSFPPPSDQMFFKILNEEILKRSDGTVSSVEKNIISKEEDKLEEMTEAEKRLKQEINDSDKINEGISNLDLEKIKEQIDSQQDLSKKEQSLTLNQPIHGKISDVLKNKPDDSQKIRSNSVAFPKEAKGNGSKLFNSLRGSLNGKKEKKKKKEEKNENQEKKEKTFGK